MELGDVYASGEDWAHAINLYDQAIRWRPDYAEAYNNRGYAYYWIGSSDQAIRDLTRAIELRPDYPFAYNSRGAAYLASGQPEQALLDFSRAIELQPDFRQAYTNRANAYLRLGRLGQALADFDRADQAPIRTIARLCGAWLVLIVLLASVLYGAWQRERRRPEHLARTPRERDGT